MFVIWCGIVMLHVMILVKGAIFNEMAPISTFVTTAALNGLNVTMGYCVRFGFKVQSPDFLSSSSANLKMSCRLETLQDLSLFLMYRFMMPSINFEAKIMLPGSMV